MATQNICVLDRWQGYHIELVSNYGAQSLLNCIPSSITANLPKAMPNPVPDVETHGIIITDQVVGNVLLAPPTKPLKDVYELAKIFRGLSSMITYQGAWVFFEDGTQEFCNILVGADGINSPILKQKLPELQIVNYGITHVGADISIPKHLMDKTNKIHGNVLALYSYPSELDNVESEKVKVGDNDPSSVIEHVKRLIRTLRPDCELTNLLLLELWDLAPKTIPNDPIKFPFKTYNPIQRRMMRDIDLMSGQFIEEYEKEMLKRTSADVLKMSRLRLPHHLGLLALLLETTF
ncbi:unnamed protein product [Rhizophagus irregularis]|uniref:FAD-binding domain-containing protein n=1 Tax=Rhizophagus irregularis TaxID=588596 RepID=A0A915Z2R6_9GLOM|nr:unnamed protein product [Rhizophagus irregularis]